MVFVSGDDDGIRSLRSMKTKEGKDAAAKTRKAVVGFDIEGGVDEGYNVTEMKMRLTTWLGKAGEVDVVAVVNVGWWRQGRRVTRI